MPLETVKLTASFKLDGSFPESLFSTYREVLGQLLDYAWEKGVTSFKRLKAEKYCELRARYPSLPSHYIYTACQMACSIYKSFRKLKRRGATKAEKPVFKKEVIMLDDHLFSLDLEGWEASIAVGGSRVRLKLLHGTYHEKFKGMRVGQAWLVKRGNDLYLKAVFSKVVEVAEMDERAVAVDVNENNVTFGTMERVVNVETRERIIRTAYFLKRRRLQSKPRLNEKPLLAKYRGRERRRVEAIYHEVANRIIDEAKKVKASTIVLEDLTNIRERIKRSKELNGRLNRWSFRKLQRIVEYKAKLAGLNVVYVEARGTSSLCPICGERLSPNGHRRLKCRCGLEEDRDVVAVKNLLRKYRMDVGASSVHPEGPPMTTERDEEYEGGRDESLF
ncbi:RNA-guided endonuclease InsQ/TnpB family protein [Candidatus Korarchaeum cryptofilum]|uniref:Transposase, IS605 OrfB family n=1 Tax=Korarchaeum cryptofilum (strain OPF8) TaxID=374847 RepID=B1L573_KORCO|nr:RNA-guided endonuclease TnpB family protein [Candidatus Korarchaeum cryptofilum]ACB07602.1 transposase, IS605 OrfB family [Candidatus Korarchaeum cryptofilum OPF8]